MNFKERYLDNMKPTVTAREFFQDLFYRSEHLWLVEATDLEYSYTVESYNWSIEDESFDHAVVVGDIGSTNKIVIPMSQEFEITQNSYWTELLNNRFKIKVSTLISLPMHELETLDVEIH
jgi:hypothetical protein